MLEKAIFWNGSKASNSEFTMVRTNVYRVYYIYCVHLIWWLIINTLSRLNPIHILSSWAALKWFGDLTKTKVKISNNVDSNKKQLSTTGKQIYQTPITRATRLINGLESTGHDTLPLVPLPIHPRRRKVSKDLFYFCIVHFVACLGPLFIASPLYLYLYPVPP